MRSKLQFLHNRSVILMAVVFTMLLLPLSQAFAQTATPDFDLDLNPAINSMFGSVSTFLPVFAPIVGIGVGISVAIALLTYLGKMLIGAFRGG